MELEYEEKISEISTNKYQEVFKTPKKKQHCNSYLTLTEKCKVSLDSKNGKCYEDIAIDLNRDPKTVSKVVKKAKAKRSLDNQHCDKGRYAKGSAKHTNEHKRFMLQWIEEGKYHSSHEVWVHLSSIKKLKDVGYDGVNNYLKSIGKWVKPRLKTLISEKHIILRKTIVKQTKMLL